MIGQLYEGSRTPHRTHVSTSVASRLLPSVICGSASGFSDPPSKSPLVISVRDILGRRTHASSTNEKMDAITDTKNIALGKVATVFI